ncbi:MAG: NADP-dependent isocitrate dehydrogenase [Acidobacteriota bacterium]
MTNTSPRITIAYGDGIGPEIMDATVRVLDAAGAGLEYDRIELGEAVYKQGVTSGVPESAWDTLRKNKVLLKAPITTPQGGGYKSVNVTLRKSLGLFANVRPCKSYAPFVVSNHPGMNLVIIRENEEDLYAGIEHQQTREVTQVLKLITRPGSEAIIRYAFAYAQAYGRRKVTCMTKDNIMKLTDGLFHRRFDAIAAEYPDIEAEHQIIDIGTARLAAQPEGLDVVVTLNLYGDILSDVAAQVAGSVGLAGSANIGPHAAMFEAIHGSAPDIAGRGVANPSGLLHAAVQLLVHIGKAEIAERIKNAWLCTLEDGIHTPDIYREGLSQRDVGTAAFADAVIERLGSSPRTLPPVHYQGTGIVIPDPEIPEPREKELVGVDIFIDWNGPGRDPQEIGKGLEAATPDGPLRLEMITNRGVMVYPRSIPETFRTDHWRCRFTAGNDTPVQFTDVLTVLGGLNENGWEVIKTEHLYLFDGQPGFSKGQGQ